MRRFKKYCYSIICCLLMILMCANEEDNAPYTNISQTIGKSVTPSVAVGNDGTVYVVWAESTGVNNFEIFFTENLGNGWSNLVNISNNTTYSVAPTMATDGSGNVHVCWWDFIFEGPDNMALYRMRRLMGHGTLFKLLPIQPRCPVRWSDCRELPLALMMWFMLCGGVT